MTLLAYIQLSTEVIACITSVVFFRSLLRQGWTLWMPFLVYTCVVEIWAAQIAASAPNSVNTWLYNPYIIISLTFHAWFLVRITPTSSWYKPVITRLLPLLAACSLAGYLLWGDRGSLLSLTLATGSVTICLLCLAFIYFQLKNPASHQSLLQVPGFWIVAGLLVFYTGISLYTSVYDFLANNGFIVLNATIQNVIPQILSLFLYTSITIDIIQCRYRLKT